MQRAVNSKHFKTFAEADRRCERSALMSRCRNRYISRYMNNLTINQYP